MEDAPHGLTPAAEAFLDAHRRMFVLSRRPDGAPTIHPMTGEWREGALWVNTYRKSQKVRNAQRDDRLSYLVTSDDGDVRFEAINVTGHASVVESVPGQPGDQRTGFDRPLGPDEVARRIRLKLDPERIDPVR